MGCSAGLLARQLHHMFGMQRKILVVDDEESILFAMREYFMTHGYQVDCAREMQEAEALLATVRYSVVIADLRLSELPSTEGIEIVRYVHERCPWTRTILLTAYGSPEIEREARRWGVDSFLHKPLPLPKVAQIVLELLGRSPPEPA
jgi:two-component system, response regulator, stage 0 sporulation protein F